jgi:hypothetical protein
MVASSMTATVPGVSRITDGFKVALTVTLSKRRAALAAGAAVAAASRIHCAMRGSGSRPCDGMV